MKATEQGVDPLSACCRPRGMPPRVGTGAILSARPLPFRHPPRVPKPIRARSYKRVLRTNSDSTVLAPAVTAQELQSAVLVILALYASMGVLKLGAEMAALVGRWNGLIDFLANSIFVA